MSVRRAAIVQSSYIPWKGFFDLIALSDVFVLYDAVQYTRHNWRNRNLVKSAAGPQWLSIPVRTKGRSRARICDIEISDAGWAARHRRTLAHHYARAPFYADYSNRLDALYSDLEGRSLLTDVNEHCIRVICGWLGITTEISRDDGSGEGLDVVERPLRLCQTLGAGELLSGPTARPYLDEARFAEAGVGLCWMDYSGYPEYPQMHPPFIHGVTILDLLLNVGPAAPEYMKGFRESRGPAHC